MFEVVTTFYTLFVPGIKKDFEFLIKIFSCLCQLISEVKNIFLIIFTYFINVSININFSNLIYLINNYQIFEQIFLKVESYFNLWIGIWPTKQKTIKHTFF